MARAIRRRRQHELDRQRRRGEQRATKAVAATTAVLGASVVFAPGAFGATFTVNTTADSAPDGCTPTTTTNGCTLREAVIAANANNNEPTVDVVDFAPAVTPQITLALGEIEITEAVTIQGPGAATLAVSGDANNDDSIDQNADSRIFAALGEYADQLTPVTISGLTLTEGASGYYYYYDPDSMTGYDIPYDGGAVNAYYADVALTDAVLTGNEATGDGGALASRAGSQTLTDTEVSGNTALGHGGGVSALAFGDNTSTEVSGSDFLDNESLGDPAFNNGPFTYPSGRGGGLNAVGYVYLDVADSAFYDNHAYDDAGEFGYGGGILATTESVDVDETTLDGNVALTGGGGAYLDGFSVAITDSTVTGNYAVGSAYSTSGGGLAVDNAYLGEVTVDDNRADRGGGARLGEDVEAYASTFSNNYAYELGGGILAAPEDGGPVLISDSTVSGNGAADAGGGINVDSYSVVFEYMSNNYYYSSDPATIANTTVAGNSAGFYGAGVYDSAFYSTSGPEPDPLPPVYLDSTIVADSTDANDLDHSGDSVGFEARFSLIEVPGTASLVSNPSGSNITGTDPQLGALTAANGGLTATHLPATTSPVVDKGTGNGLTDDQRGQSRTLQRPPTNAADGTDIGSVELPAQSGGDNNGGGNGAQKSCAGKPVTGTGGTPGNDVLAGTAGANTIKGLGGNDLICGLGKRDKLVGGGGRDRLIGGGGPDRLRGGAGRDVLIGGAGADRLLGGGGLDKLKGGPGRDIQRQ